MGIAAALLPELDHEMASTRRLLERVPAERAAWKPHEKSMSLGDLSLHLANLPSWIPLIIHRTDLDPARDLNLPPRRFTTTEDMLSAFDENVHAGRAALAGASDADMLVSWTFKRAGKTMFSLPRAACMRSFILSHMIHHRGQHSVYLRMCGVALPPIYGPTADAAI